jgi:lipoate-protein ligase A
MKMKHGTLNADYKVAGGKLLRVALNLESAEEGLVITSITITGDFFMHPEDAIENLEDSLIRVPFQESEIHKIVDAFFKGDVEVIGANPEDVTRVIMNVS